MEAFDEQGLSNSPRSSSNRDSLVWFGAHLGLFALLVLLIEVTRPFVSWLPLALYGLLAVVVYVWMLLYKKEVTTIHERFEEEDRKEKARDVAMMAEWEHGRRRGGRARDVESTDDEPALKTRDYWDLLRLHVAVIAVGFFALVIAYALFTRELTGVMPTLYNAELPIDHAQAVAYSFDQFFDALTAGLSGTVDLHVSGLKAVTPLSKGLAFVFHFAVGAAIIKTAVTEGRIYRALSSRTASPQ